MTPAPRSPRPAISCVMPAFNEAENLPLVLADVTQQLAALTDRWELIVVDDGSLDATPAAMRPWVAKPGVRYVRLSRNFGKEAALTAGIDRAEGEVVLLMDADGQHPTTLLPRMLDTWLAGADMVCAARSSRADESWRKRVGTRLFYRLVNSNPSVQIPVNAGDFRLMDRRVVDALKSLPERNRFMKGLYAWVGFRTEIIDYLPSERLSGHSSFSMKGLTRLAFTGVTAFTNLPLRLWSGVGALVALGAITFGTWIIIDHFVNGSDVPGWATLVVGLSFFSGVQLLSIGILGEYVGRIFDEVKQRPVYIIGAEAGRGALTPPTDAAA
ncbi:glycosyltransferase family 2 protein [Piscinibacter sp.]|jgi:glycosyltransferase involved in cell wall biosynthesis|uniref:glycosyltransferase family 2 protein n=1 Tax=Piscinibacter sp. TaxID=1903157 RepID=UPI0035597E14